MLAQHKADLNVASSFGCVSGMRPHRLALTVMGLWCRRLQTPAYLACTNGHVEAVSVLIQHKAVMDTPTMDGWVSTLACLRTETTLFVSDADARSRTG